MMRRSPKDPKSLPLFDHDLPASVAVPARTLKVSSSGCLRRFPCRHTRIPKFGTSTQEITEGGIPYLVNEFWTARQRQPRIHEISYRACFKPQLPRFFIERLTQPGEIVYDPFMGRGTTPIQAALMGRKPGNDINPLSILAIPASADAAFFWPQIAARLATVARGCGAAEREDLLAFYHPETLRRI